MAGVVPLVCVAVPHVHMGVSYDVASVMGQAAGNGITTRSVEKDKIG